MKKKQDDIQAEYDSYRKFAEQEVEVCHEVIQRQKVMHNKLFTELKSLKIILEVPKFREALPKENKQG